MHIFTFVTSCLEKACKFCRAKISNQHNNIGSEHATRCKLTPTPPTYKFLHLLNYQRRSISPFLSAVFYPSPALSSLLFQLNISSINFSLTRSISSCSTLGDSHVRISCSSRQLFRIFPLSGCPKSLAMNSHDVDEQIELEIFTKKYVFQHAFFASFIQVKK